MPPSQGCASGSVLSLACALACLGLTGISWETHAQSPTESYPLELARWFPLFTAKMAAGYNDNVLLSEANQQESAFLGGGLEMFLSSLPEEPTVWELFLSFDDLHYLESIDVDKEQIGFAQAHWQQELGEGTEVQGELQYIYQDQVLDVSVTEADLDILQVTGHALIANPFLRHQLVPQRWALEAGFPIERQWFEEPLDDYLVIGPEARLSYSYRYQSQCRLSYRFQNRDYDSDPLLTRDGQPIPGTTRSFHQNEVEGMWQHYWDASRRWRSTTRLGYKISKDTGSGYFDFDRSQIRHELRYRSDPWTVAAEVRYTDYRYPVQPASPGSNDKHRRDEWRFSLRMERELGKHWRLFVEMDREETNSNNPLEEYTVQKGTGGLAWDW